jgi:hypothetical protein
MSSTAAFITPDWSSRLKLLASLGAFVAWAASHQYWLIPMARSLECTDPCSQLGTLRFIAVYLALLPLPFSLLIARYAQRIFSSGQAPPPGSWQLFRIKVSTGWQARLTAYWNIGLALCAALGTGYLAYALDWSYIFCIAEPCGCGA